MSDDFRKLIPPVTQLLTRSEVVSLIDQFGADLVRAKLLAAIERLRQRHAVDDLVSSRPDAENKIIGWLIADMDRWLMKTPRKVINATGVLLHTGLGRAPLADAARRAITDTAGACLLEVDPESGARSYRGFQVHELLSALTRCEDSLIVNNNAGATLLLLQALCKGREVLISRGQLVEIGGSFRLPEIFETAGVVLREVGTTNRTHVNDYAAAINELTAAILRVHASNYRIVGFTAEPSCVELATLAHDRGLMMFDDIGSGQLFQNPVLAGFGEPDFRTSIDAGADLVLGSGDKLLGGPQAGILLGRAPLIASLRHHPLARCLRIDKLSLAALQATLLIHARGAAADELPLCQMLQADCALLRQRAESLVAELDSESDVMLQIVPSVAEIGGGSCAGHQIPSVALSLRASNSDAETLARRLRMSVPAVWGRIESDAVLLDLRSVDPCDDRSLCQVVKSLITAGPASP
jgi:L-seryl-tRNA(Ser) seleniumtransferase